MKEYLPYGRQSVGPEEERRVRDVLQSDWLTQGPKVVEFEAALNRTCGSAHAVAVSHGTTALYLACRAAGGEQVRAHACLVAVVEEGRIRRLDEYLDARAIAPLTGG